jgi:hypothetical protein
LHVTQDLKDSLIKAISVPIIHHYLLVVGVHSAFHGRPNVQVHRRSLTTVTRFDRRNKRIQSCIFATFTASGATACSASFCAIE